MNFIWRQTLAIQIELFNNNNKDDGNEILIVPIKLTSIQFEVVL